MGIFEFVIFLVLISTVGKVLSDRRSRRSLPGDSLQIKGEELEDIRDTVGELSRRLERLEEERDFYKDLLDAPERRRKLPEPGEGEGGTEAGGPS